MGSLVQTGFWLALTRAARQKLAAIGVEKASPPQAGLHTQPSEPTNVIEPDEGSAQASVASTARSDSTFAAAPSAVQAARKPLTPFLIDRHNADIKAVFGLGQRKPQATQTREAGLRSEPGITPIAQSTVVQSTDVQRTGAQTALHEKLQSMNRDLSDLECATATLDWAAARQNGFNIKSIHDLQVVKGIGPKTAALLTQAGIVTLADLADTSGQRLRQVLRASGPHHRLAQPERWIEQATLVMLGQWQSLRQIQAASKRVRKVKQKI